MRKKNWRRLDSDLRVRYTLRAVRPSLGRLRSLHYTFVKPSSIQGSDERIEASQFSIYIAVLEREASAQIGEGANMRFVCGGYFWQLVGFLATETTGR